MTNKKIFLTITFLIFIQCAFSQVKLSFGAEIGLNSSGLPNKHQYTIASRNDLVKVTNRPIISPKIGMWLRMDLNKYFYSNIGLQYFKVGNKYHYHRDGNNLASHKKYTSDEWQNQSFNKISIPLSVGYNVRIKKCVFNFGIGYRLNHFTKGEHTYKTSFVEENKPSNSNIIETTNPFDKTQYSIIAKRWNSGLFYEIGMHITKKIKLELAFAKNQTIIYGNTFAWEGFYEFYNRSDISISIKYHIR